MNKIYALLLLLLCTVSLQISLAQNSRDVRLRTKGYVSPQEIVSLDSTMRMDQALLVINELAKQYAGKVVIDLEKHRNPIGVYVVNQHWRDALDMILSRNGLTYVEEPEYIRIVSQNATTGGLQAQIPGGPGPTAGTTEPPPTLDSRDVKISAAFFSTDLQKLQTYGISWDFFRAKPKEPVIHSIFNAGMQKSDTMWGPNPGPIDDGLTALQSPPEFKFANMGALVKFYGQNNLGEVVNSPEVTVRSGQKGKIQVGKNIFVISRDVAGNALQQQVQTGTIVEVTPQVFTQSDTDFIYLDLSISQGDAGVGATGVEVTKDEVSTRVLLYDGEETVIGGLYTTSDVSSREGIPFLKDLPWWFFGLRYVFGSDIINKKKSELIVLLKAELTESIRARIGATHYSERDLIDAQRKAFSKEHDNVREKK